MTCFQYVEHEVNINKQEETTMIGIIGAMEEEVAELKKDMQIEETTEQAGMVFCKGTLGGKDVVIVRSGIGKVNAGICVQILEE